MKKVRVCVLLTYSTEVEEGKEYEAEDRLRDALNEVKELKDYSLFMGEGVVEV